MIKHTNRRSFLKLAALSSLYSISGSAGAIVAMEEGVKKITLLHTNDTHSRIDPYPDNDPNFPGMGGYARRAALVNMLRADDPELLLFDAGDIFQGTPYYNMYGGKLELKLMSEIGYDGATVGNHEFDNGLDGFFEVLPYAKFPFISANLDFSQTLLKDKTIPYAVWRKKGVRIGVYGLGIDPQGLVSPAHFQDTVYLDPIEIARDVEVRLKQRHRCQLIICLSHLGYSYNHDKVSDVVVAANTKYTDVIIGGHTHTRLEPPAMIKNMSGNNVAIGQTGSGGVRLGVMEVYLSDEAEQKSFAHNTIKII